MATLKCLIGSFIYVLRHFRTVQTKIFAAVASGCDHVVHVSLHGSDKPNIDPGHKVWALCPGQPMLGYSVPGQFGMMHELGEAQPLWMCSRAKQTPLVPKRPHSCVPAAALQPSFSSSFG